MVLTNKIKRAILFGHVVAFASGNALPQQNQDLKWISTNYMLAPFREQVRLGWLHLGVKCGYLMVALAPSWGQLRRFWGCVESYIFGPCCFGIVKNPRLHLRNARPLALKAKQNEIKNCPKTQKLRQNANLHGSKKRNQKSFKSHFQNAPPSGPAASTFGAAGRIKEPPLAELYEMTMVFAKVARPAPTERCGRI